MEFFSLINCMDGRVQLPVIRYLQDRYQVKFVDVITEAGPNLILAEQRDTTRLDSIFSRISISIENHGSEGIAVAGHHDCAGNPAPEAMQISHIRQAVGFLRQHYPEMEMIGLWVDDNWKVNEVA